MSERVFGPADGQIVQRVPGQGSAVLVAGGKVGGEDRIGHRPGDDAAVWWAGFRTPQAAVDTVLVQRSLRGVLAGAVTAPGHTVPASLGLALTVAEHLDTSRRARLRGGWAQAVVTCPAPPDWRAPDGFLFLPHLITLHPSTPGGVRDKAVWEIIERDAAELVHGEPLPPEPLRMLVHDNLGTLLGLRAQARDGRLPASPLGRLIGECATDGPLSIHTLYRQAHRLAEILPDHARGRS